MNAEAARAQCRSRERRESGTDGAGFRDEQDGQDGGGASLQARHGQRATLADRRVGDADERGSDVTKRGSGGVMTGSGSRCGEVVRSDGGASRAQAQWGYLEEIVKLNRDTRVRDRKHGQM